MTEQPTVESVDFDLDADDDSNELPPLCSFRLGDRVWHVKNEELITLDLINKALTGMQVADYFHSVLVDDEWAAFKQMLLEPPSTVTIGKVRRAMNRTAEKILGFPTMSDSGSSTASSARVRKHASSAGRSSSPGTRRRASGE